MLRILFAALVLCLSLQVSGLAAYAFNSTCEEDCPDDGPGRQCPPNCTFCSCCAHPRAVSAPVAPALPLRVATRQPFVVVRTTPQTPDPAEILHVPKLLVA